jgi:hypothetical protein
MIAVNLGEHDSRIGDMTVGSLLFIGEGRKRMAASPQSKR